jgi:hypothetical protein
MNNIMKEYNRETKKWEEPKPTTKGSLKKRELCKAHKPHDFVLVIPKHRSNYRPYSAEIVAEYYKIEDEKDAFEKKNDERFIELGLMHRYSWKNYYTPRHYICAVCGKEKTQYKDEPLPTSE